MKIAVVPNLKKEKAKACTDEVLSILASCGCEFFLKTDLFNEDGVYTEAVEPELCDCDMFIAVGGDGTIIHAAKTAARCGKPILGVNAGKLGFTAGVERNDLFLLSNLPNGRYTTESRAMLSVEIYSGKQRKICLALNDAVVSGELSKILDYRMALGEQRWYRYRADGFIVATPTGSTAYSLSAGGPVIEPAMNCIVYTPICPHSLFDRSIIFSERTKLQLELPENPGMLLLTVDGEEPVSLRPGDRLVFSLAERTAQFIKLGQTSFYDILNQKMVENGQ